VHLHSEHRLFIHLFAVSAFDEVLQAWQDASVVAVALEQVFARERCAHLACAVRDRGLAVVVVEHAEENAVPTPRQESEPVDNVAPEPSTGASGPCHVGPPVLVQPVIVVDVAHGLKVVLRNPGKDHLVLAYLF